MKPAITLLTNTIPPKQCHWLKGARWIKRLILGKRPLVDQYEGHPAVTRSALKGLKNIGADFNYNPTTLSEVGNIVLVLSNLDALRQAVDLKKRRQIQKLFAGPNLVINPSDERELLCKKEIDGYIVPSPWVHDFYVQEVPELLGKCIIWPSGIDMNEWTPAKPQWNKNVLIYDKLNHGQPIHAYREFLANRGWNSSIIRYGFYSKNQFLQMLRESQLAIFFSSSESQGIALLECWATNVPTLVWNQGWTFLKEKKKIIPASSAPYLDANFGYFFSDWGTFLEAFQKWENVQLHPRIHACTHFSDETCAKQLLEILRYD